MESGVAGGLYGGVIPCYQGSRVFVVTTGYVTGATTWTRHKASTCGYEGGLGPLPLGASRASANEEEIALRQLLQGR